MKKWLFFVVSSLLLVSACQSGSPYRSRLAEAERLMDLHFDSACHLLDSIPIAKLQEGWERALYHLLVTEVAYRRYQPIENDSLLDECAKQFEASGDHQHLAATYYYKGVLAYDLWNRKEEAIKRLKQAEQLAEKTDDEQLRNKIYEELHHVNLRAQNYLLALDYAKQFLHSSVVLGQPELICRAYDDLALDFLNLDEPDSVSYYRKECFALLERLGQQNAYYFANYASELIEAGQYAEARPWLMKAIELEPMPNEYMMLGIIAQHEGDTLQARKNWEHAITFGDVRFMVKAYEYLAALYMERGDYQTALTLRQYADSVEEASDKQNWTEQMADIQRKYDTAVLEQKTISLINHWLIFFILALIILLILSGCLFHFRRKAHEYRSAMDDSLVKINDYSRKMELLQATGRGFEQEIETLRSQIDRLREATSKQLGRGKETYDLIAAGNTPAHFDTETEQNFIDYYAFTFNTEFTSLIRQYKALSLRHTTFLVLQQMGLNDKQVQHVLDVSDTTIRSYRYRIRKAKWFFNSPRLI